jgi:hypothetical protein
LLLCTHRGEGVSSAELLVLVEATTILVRSPKATCHLVLMTSTRHERIRLLLCVEVVLHLHLLLAHLLLAHCILHHGLLLHGNRLEESVLLLLLGIEWIGRKTAIHLFFRLASHWFTLANWCLTWSLDIEGVERFLLSLRRLLLSNIVASSCEKVIHTAKQINWCYWLSRLSLLCVLRHEVVKVEGCSASRCLRLLLGSCVVTKVEIKFVLLLAGTLSLWVCIFSLVWWLFFLAFLLFIVLTSFVISQIAKAVVKPKVEVNGLLALLRLFFLVLLGRFDFVFLCSALSLLFSILLLDDLAGEAIFSRCGFDHGGYVFSERVRLVWIVLLLSVPGEGWLCLLSF